MVLPAQPLAKCNLDRVVADALIDPLRMPETATTVLGVSPSKIDAFALDDQWPLANLGVDRAHVFADDSQE